MRDRIAIIDINTKKFKAISYKQYDENNILQIVVLENGIIKGLSNYITTVRFQLPSGKIYKINGIIVYLPGLHNLQMLRMSLRQYGILVK